MKKWLIGIVIGVLALVVGVVLIIAMNLNSIVKKVVNIEGPRLTKVKVELADVSLSPLSGKGEIRGLVVGNPEGYKSPSAIKLELASLQVVPKSLLSDKIVVKSVVVQAPEITLEGDLQKNNLTKILDNVQAATGRQGETKPTGKDQGPEKKFQVDEFLLKDAKVNLVLPGLGSRNITLSNIELRNLGTGPEGITTGELTSRILQAVLTQVVANAAAGAVTDALKNPTDALNKAVPGIGNFLKKK